MDRNRTQFFQLVCDSFLNCNGPFSLIIWSIIFGVVWTIHIILRFFCLGNDIIDDSYRLYVLILIHSIQLFLIYCGLKLIFRTPMRLRDLVVSPILLLFIFIEIVIFFIYILVSLQHERKHVMLNVLVSTFIFIVVSSYMLFEIYYHAWRNGEIRLGYNHV